MSDPREAVARFVRRSGRPESAEHRAATALQERDGGVAALPEMYERLMGVIAGRPGTRRVVTVEGEVEQTYQRLLAELRPAPDPAAG